MHLTNLVQLIKLIAEPIHTLKLSNLTTGELVYANT